ncbi:MAG: methylmalonyl Co-A mutase-associated GTPase MeaB [Gemmatimonadetes bacterium]|nr:methylmalonyl Co-A mutase-associated GTPase MeaB [Gemmatimonadota bacterium]
MLLPLLASFHERGRAGLARAISLVENERPGFEAFLHAVLQGAPPSARRVGFTGPPGAGKSTLIAAVATAYRAAGDRVGVVAVDPTSPFSGGALLGDRIRMNELSTDPGMFIRSMATRGSLGGLATTTREVIDLMDAFGFERVLVETVGVGQTELEITGAADTVVVVLVPESGDAIQAMKAGLMEIADVFVVNKADRPGADRLLKEIRTAIHLRSGETGRDAPGHHAVDLAAVGRRAARRRADQEMPSERAAPAEVAPSAWTIPVLRTVAQTGEGVPEAIAAVDAHRVWLEASGTLASRRRARAERRIRDVAERELRRRAWTDPEVLAALAAGLEAVTDGRETPYSAARPIVGRVVGKGGAR